METEERGLICVPPENHQEGSVLISVSQELAEHFALVKRVRDEAIKDVECSFAQKSSVINSTTAVIKDLSRVQLDLYNSALVARLQQACYNALKEVDPTLQNQVMAAMERQFEQIV